MLKFLFIHLILLSAVLNSYAVLPTREIDSAVPITSLNDECSTNSIEKSFYCRGSRALRNVIHNLNKSEKPIVIVRGLEIVRSRDASVNATEEHINNVAAGNENGVDESIIARFSEFLRTHELNIKFSDLLAEESERFLARDLEWKSVKSNIAANGGYGAGYIDEARKKDKGQGMLMAVALMFGKMMAVLGLGGIGALAMKALGIAMAALMMAGIVGVKSLSQNGHGHESSHSVQYLTPDAHHRRRRRRSLSLSKQLYASKKTKEIMNSAEMAYHGWKL